jgi:AcrR family transcriptional regulator
MTTAMRLFRRHGFDAVTMEQIAEAADIAKGTLYDYFPVKEAILSACLDHESLARNAERIVRMRAMADTRSRLTASLVELIEAVRAQPDIFERYFTYRTQQMVSSELLEALFEFSFIIVAQQYYRAPGEFDAAWAIGQCVELFMIAARNGRP